MKRKIVINTGMEYFDGFYFDTMCYNVKKPDSKEIVRFVFFMNGESLQRAILSNNPLFKCSVEVTSIPAKLRFNDLFEYAALLSPYGYRDNTIEDMLDLMNQVFGSWRFSFIEGQTIIINEETKKDVATKDTFISRKYTSRIYTGQHGYHHSHSLVSNTPHKPYRYRVGVELEIEAKNSTELETIRKYKSNWFFMERDGSLNDYGVEIITIPLLPIDAKSTKFWTPLCSELHKKAVSWDSSNCGLHIHIGREILGRTDKVRSETIGKMLYLYHHFVKDTPFNTAIYGRSRAYHDIECKSSLVKAVDILGNKVLKNKKFRNEIDKELKDKSNTERYFDVNILNANTIEFRRGKGSLNPTRICAIVEYSEHLCLYAKRAKWEDISFDNFIKYLNANINRDGALFELMRSKGLIVEKK